MRMKEGEHAIYLGKEYTSGRMANGKLVLRSTDIRDVEKGFEPCKPFRIKRLEEEIVCMKYVDLSEVEDYYLLRTRALYRGYVFQVLEETEDQFSITSPTGDYRVWLSLGMKLIDKGVYQKWIPKEEAAIRIEKEIYEPGKGFVSPTVIYEEKKDGILWEDEKEKSHGGGKLSEIWRKFWKDDRF